MLNFDRVIYSMFFHSMTSLLIAQPQSEAEEAVFYPASEKKRGVSIGHARSRDGSGNPNLVLYVLSGRFHK